MYTVLPYRHSDKRNVILPLLHIHLTLTMHKEQVFCLSKSLDKNYYHLFISGKFF